jgi:chitin-binding protein
MFARPRLGRLVAAGIVALLLSVAAAGMADAHGAPLDPVSRSVACGSEGNATHTAACQAARAGDQGQWYEQWDNVRVADVNGRDRQTIPDGRLCSGGIDNFGGLDLARADWPATQVRAGAKFTFRYRATIPHEGTFRMYVTKDGYDPTRPLRWSDLETKPFVTVTDPRFDGGAYAFTAVLPRGRVGRQLLYTIWQNSSTPDTYYSCSDVVFAAPAVSGGATRKPTSEPSVAATGKVSPVAGQVDATVGGFGPVAATTAETPGHSGNSPPRLALAGAGLIALAAGATATGVYRVRRRR